MRQLCERAFSAKEEKTYRKEQIYNIPRLGGNFPSEQIKRSYPQAYTPRASTSRESVLEFLYGEKPRAATLSFSVEL